MKKQHCEDKYLLEARHIHMIGIGGSGMCPIAELLLSRGYMVTGSDKNDNDNVKRLKSLGITVYKEHKAENIIGANLFNLVLVSGLSIALSPFNVPADKLIFGMNAALVVDIPLMLTVMLIMLLPAFIKKRLYRWQGIVLLCLYAAYTVFQFAF